LPNCSFFSFLNEATTSGVHTGPGATQFTRIPRSMRPCARPLFEYAGATNSSPDNDKTTKP